MYSHLADYFPDFEGKLVFVTQTILLAWKITCDSRENLI